MYMPALINKQRIVVLFDICISAYVHRTCKSSFNGLCQGQSPEIFELLHITHMPLKLGNWIFSDHICHYMATCEEVGLQLKFILRKP